MSLAMYTREKKRTEPGHEKMCHFICKQQRRRSASASTQSDQRLCSRCLDSIISLDSIAEISRTYQASVAAQAGLCLAVFSCRGSYTAVLQNKNQKWDPLRAMKTFIRRKVGHTTYFRLIKPHQWPCNDLAAKARGNTLQFCEFQIGSRFKDWYKSKWGPNN